MNSIQSQDGGYFGEIIWMANNGLAFFIFISYGIAWAITASYFKKVPLAKQCRRMNAIIYHFLQNSLSSVIVYRLGYNRIKYNHNYLIICNIIPSRNLL